MAEDIMIEDTSRLTVGLLDVDVTDLRTIAGTDSFDRMATHRRLAEIERRILRIEAFLGPF